ncbi:MAG: FAD-binding oxidoreductase [Alphaproteobacteria bacterium]|nr:FAD-binding oxidoreductase [Alphaproteobacteria bacterium]MBU1551373.1 FAD-binding oxidoreductase [Alphaproteobacteria bacterium]MBU2336528.1 FAD-binding oxidoreductase [Alphaproteobacteria bacterium]MBU2387942.1 FAD-binding oxidoreductase [Alphaproteobacteria bacterium]
MKEVKRDQLLAELRLGLGASAVLSGSDLPERNRTDWSFLPYADPMAVVRPGSTEEVAKALRLCHGAGVSVTPQGGLTGLCGGARPLDGGIALSLERMHGIEAIDPVGMTMTVRAGTPLEVIQKAADDAGLLFSLDLGARGSCAIGGNLSTNAGGNRVIRYGMAKDLVLGLEAVTVDGTVISMMNRMIKNNAGYDLKQLFLGSEGTLGVITRAVLRLHPKPGCVQAALCVVTGYDQVLALLAGARRNLGPLLSAFEVMWADYWTLYADHVPGARPPVSLDAGSHVVLIEMQGLDEAIDGGRFSTWLETLFDDGTVVDGVVSRSLADLQAFWTTRDAAAEFANPDVAGPHVSFDVGLPVALMDEFASRSSTALSQTLGCRSVHYGHVGDGNLHVVAWVKGMTPQPLSAISDIVYGIVKELDGTVSAEHGIGTLKKPYLGYSRSPVEIDLMRRLKSCMDPRGLLNPGKVFD